MSALLQAAPLAFRPMLETDLDQIIRIEKAAYPYPWTLGNFRDCLASGYACWVAEVRDELVGYSVLLTGAGEGHVLNCCVSPHWQGQGFGNRLMLHLIETARGHCVDCLYLEVRPSNTRAIRLYEGLGFEGIALRRGYYPADGGREDALVMRLPL